MHSNSIWIHTRQKFAGNSTCICSRAHGIAFFRICSTRTRDRQLQFRGTVSTGFWNFSSRSMSRGNSSFASASLCSLVGRSCQNLEKTNIPGGAVTCLAAMGLQSPDICTTIKPTACSRTWILGILWGVKLACHSCACMAGSGIFSTQLYCPQVRKKVQETLFLRYACSGQKAFGGVLEGRWRQRLRGRCNEEISPGMVCMCRAPQPDAFWTFSSSIAGRAPCKQRDAFRFALFSATGLRDVLVVESLL